MKNSLHLSSSFANVPFSFFDKASFKRSTTSFKSIVWLSLSLSMILSSCNKNEACIDGPTEVMVGEEVTYTFCGTAKEIEWEIHDGYETKTYTGDQVTVTFEKPTEYAQIYMYAKGGLLKSTDDLNIGIRVKNEGFKVRVYDSQYSNGNTNIEHIANAEIDLYTSYTCWQDGTETEACYLGSATTDAEGFAVFPDVSIGTYVVDARGYEIHANWDENVRNMEVMYESHMEYSDNHGYIYLNYNGTYLLSKPEKWSLTGAKIDGTDVWGNISECAKDNYLVFQKDLTWEYKEGDNVCPEPTESNGMYTKPYLSSYPNFDAASISTSNVSGSLQGASMTLIDENTIWVYQYIQDSGTGSSYNIEYEFTKG